MGNINTRQGASRVCLLYILAVVLSESDRKWRYLATYKSRRGCQYDIRPGFSNRKFHFISLHLTKSH